MKAATIPLLAALASAPAFATEQVIDFETAPSFASVADHYGAWGVLFGDDALALQNDDLGPYFSNAPSPLGVMAPVGPAATMNVAGGFTAMVSFSYSASAFVSDAVQVWSGLDGSGTLLASFSLVNNAQAGCNDSPFCRFDRLSTTFAGVARSMTFGGAANVAAIDDIAVTAVPEPATLLMAALGVCALVARRRLVA